MQASLDGLVARFNALFDAVHGIRLSRPMLAEGDLDHWQRAADQHPNNPDYRRRRGGGCCGALADAGLEVCLVRRTIFNLY
jgi:hypothetical protein